jgi:hypothetical protein
MDIQVNTGQSALHYLTKVDNDVEFNLVSHHRPQQDVKMSDHLKARIVGSLEAAYLILSLQTHV